MPQLPKISREDILNALGLESQKTTMGYVVPAVAFIGLGVVIGASLGLLFAPKTGAEMRKDMKNRVPFRTSEEESTFSKKDSRAEQPKSNGALSKTHSAAV